MKKILITGSNGLLGQKLILQLVNHPKFKILGISRGENRLLAVPFDYENIDICDELAVKQVFRSFSPDIVIHTAAMTNVDACETDKDGCTLLNVKSTEYILEACKESKAHIIHLSTDFIFDGLSGPYREEDKPNPLSFYGNSKLDAERMVEVYPYKWSIVRTVLVYGTLPDLSRSNIVLWAKGALEKGKDLQVVDDQFRTPTLAEDLAQGCILIAELGKEGIYNISGPDFMSILELVQRVADFFKLPKDHIHSVSSSTLNQTAKRPAITGFNIEKARKYLGYKPHNFEEGLALVGKQLGN